MEGHDVARAFHAVDDRNEVRFRVLQELQQHEFRIDATILTKARAYERIRRTNLRFYKTGWFLHLKYVAPVAPVVTADRADGLMVVAASINTAMKREAVEFAVDDVARQVALSADVRTACWPSSVDPALQVADYCAWAIQRKWHSGKDDAYRFIADHVASEFFPFGPG